jgi:hypothetical protein
LFIILSERLGVVGAKYDVEAARARGYDIDALIWGGFIGESSPTKPRKASKVSDKTDNTKD